jgi:hypothetical protein
MMSRARIPGRWLLKPVLATLTILLLSPTHMVAQKRGVALVIGNTAYSIDKLKNAVADAQDVATAFKNLGFDVTLKQDVGLTDFNAAIQTFRQGAMADKGIAVFYFSGHGIQVNGQSYLIPVDLGGTADLSSLVNLQSVFDALGARSGPNLIIIDACRVNPFATPTNGWLQGLAMPANPPPNSLIAYSTSPGSVAADGNGTHSPYTRALLRYIYIPGQNLSDLFGNVRSDVEANTDNAQVPWENTSAPPAVFLRPSVSVLAKFVAVDDDAIIMINGKVVFDWNQEGPGPKGIRLDQLANDVVVKVYNQRSYTGGIQGLGGHLPEGWKYVLDLSRSDGSPLISLSGGEDVPADNGPHHGKLFTVATLQLIIDEKTGHVSVANAAPEVWKH